MAKGRIQKRRKKLEECKNTKTWYRSFYSKARQRLVLLLKAVVILILSYVMTVVIGLIPVNTNFQPLPTGIEVILSSDMIHAAITLPIITKTIDWRQEFPSHFFSGNVASATKIMFGWGDRAFFTETRTLSDLRLSTALKALLWPTESSLHVYLLDRRPLYKYTRTVRISENQYLRLVNYIKRTVRRNQFGSPKLIPGIAYSPYDAFFESYGSYHALNTCNTWVGRGMAEAGIKTGWLTPLPLTVLLYLP